MQRGMSIGTYDPLASFIQALIRPRLPRCRNHLLDGRALIDATVRPQLADGKGNKDRTKGQARQSHLVHDAFTLCVRLDTTAWGHQPAARTDAAAARPPG
ncbi:hypothetical protein NicSoilB11_40770 [Arthrobacter sp. NicSoilB11]|nr:hypothetical protein NicSoilB11_40770 [Arthrobacter sp. NicSoilB11]